MYIQAVDLERFQEFLFVGRPDHFDELPVVWIVQGRTPDDEYQVRIPVPRKDVPTLIKALEEINHEC